MKKVLVYVGIVVGVFLVFFIGSAVGTSGAETTLHEKKVDVQSVDKEISKTKKELDSLKDELAQAKETIQQSIKSGNDLHDTEAKLKNVQSELDQKLAEGQKDIDAKLNEAKSQLSDAQAQLKDTQVKLASAQGQLLKAEGAPKTLGSGQYVVGKDIPSGRYVAHALGRGSNFFVYDGGNGSATVNTILGTAGGIGSGDYTFFCSDGDIIETHESVRLTPVQ